MKDFHYWLNESSDFGPIFKDSAVKEGDYVEITRSGENFGRIMARVVEVKKGATTYNKTDAIKVQPTDFSTQHERKIGIFNKKLPYWLEIPHREDPSTGKENNPTVWLLNSKWIRV